MLSSWDVLFFMSGIKPFDTKGVIRSPQAWIIASLEFPDTPAAPN